ncbi:MAG: hypothetical protein CL910_13160 [Deltaproteobacteria bacterium]|jgi:hypothetical protein|nr:hypothetical protein [Deltaproteobacteria bacterium]
MARSNRMSVQKRLREKKKAEAAALKREERSRKDPAESGGGGGGVAERDDLEGYGVIVPPADESPES